MCICLLSWQNMHNTNKQDQTRPPGDWMESKILGGWCRQNVWQLTSMWLWVRYASIAMHSHIFVDTKIKQWPTLPLDAFSDQIMEANIVWNDVVFFDIHQAVDGDVPADKTPFWPGSWVHESNSVIALHFCQHIQREDRIYIDKKDCLLVGNSR